MPEAGRAGPAHVLELDGVGRSFGPVRALDGVSVTIRSGEVHALMGENGAGKSTLIGVLAGLHRPDAGVVRLDGRDVAAGNPAAMRAAGLRFIHQELHPVPGLSVAENMHLDHAWPTRFGLIDWRRLNRSAAVALGRLGLGRLDPRAPMSSLGAGDQMLVRIAASLIGEGAWLYVMDEPTAALTAEESGRLFDVVGALIAAGAGVLYVSHRMGEVMRLADRITVLRDGRLVSTRPRAEVSERQVIEHMTGRDLGALFPPRETPVGARIVLEARGLSGAGLRRADLALREGEILGVAGLAGSGRGALLRAIMGDGRRSGRLTLDADPVGGTLPEAWRQGLAYVPRERRAEGLMPGRAISENVALPHLAWLARGALFRDAARERWLAREIGARVRLGAASVAQPCRELSGGNQQKVLFARAIAGRPRVLLLDEPTRGVDIGARFDIYRLIRGLSAEGVAVVLASSDLPELLGLSDRIAVMRDGELAEIAAGEGLTEAGLLARFYHRGDAAA